MGHQWPYGRIADEALGAGPELCRCVTLMSQTTASDPAAWMAGRKPAVRKGIAH